MNIAQPTPACLRLPAIAKYPALAQNAPALLANRHLVLYANSKPINEMSFVVFPVESALLDNKLIHPAFLAGHR